MEYGKITTKNVKYYHVDPIKTADVVANADKKRDIYGSMRKKAYICTNKKSHPEPEIFRFGKTIEKNAFAGIGRSCCGEKKIFPFMHLDHVCESGSEPCPEIGIKSAGHDLMMNIS